VLSHHFQAQADKPVPGPEGDDEAEGGNEDGLTLEAELERGLSPYSNLATRFLAGGESLEGELPADALDRARENIERFTFVGLTERLDEGVILLSTALGVAPAGYPRRQGTGDRPTAAEVPGDVRRLIETHNELDIELYRLARERFDAEIAAAGDVAAQVEELKLKQAAAMQEAEADRAARKSARRDQRHSARRGDDLADLDAGDLRAEIVALESRLQAVEAALGIEAAEVAPRAKKRARVARPKKSKPA
jgi:hypothetical protein